MAQTVQTINGHSYTVTTDSAGNVIATVGCDLLPSVAPPSVLSSAQRTALTALTSQASATWTATQQAQALQLILQILGAGAT